MSHETTGSEIAIIGRAGRFPGAPDVEAFWRNLAAGVESITFFTPEELRAAGIPEEALRDPGYVPARGVVADADAFDAPLFTMSPREARITDPQHRLFLETSWAALEDAGCDPSRFPGLIGVFAGSSLSRYMLHVHADPELARAVDALQLTMANDKDYLTTRVSYKLGLEGPAFTVQTACSTSLVAVHLACQSLLNGECDLGLAGGVSVQWPQESGYQWTAGMALSPDGHCRAFDARGQGTVVGHGAGIVVLRRLEDALAAGDAIRAVIRGSAINNDGAHKVGFTAPRVEGQAKAIRAAQIVAEVDAREITYVEAHGTGTHLGDPIEVAALTRAFRATTKDTGFCALGSVKTNIGHLDAAAGVAGLIKTVLALEHRQIPPSLGCETVNPRIDFAASPFFVNRELRDWAAEDGEPRRAGVSSFGIGGTNAHAVLEEAPPRESSGPAREHQLLILSARTEEALDAAAERLAAHLENHPETNLADTAFTLRMGRRELEHRRAVVCTDRVRSGRAVSAQSVDGRAAAFLFPGLGGQHPGMASGLLTGLSIEPLFRREIETCAEVLKPLLGIDSLKLLLPPAGTEEAAAELLDDIAVSMPVLFAVEQSLGRLWMSWGVTPKALLGHSLGEYAAACLAGVFSTEDGLRIMAARGRLIAEMPPGAMLSVALSAEEAVPFLDLGDLWIAAVNGPRTVVFSGTLDAVAELERRLEAAGKSPRRVRARGAYHSPLAAPILDRFAAEVAKLRLREPSLPFLSNLTGTWIRRDQATDPAYWTEHLRSTVRFADGLAELLRDPAVVPVELGPGRTLATLAAERLGGGRPALTSLRHPRADAADAADAAVLYGSLGRLWAEGVPVDWSAFAADERRQRVPLPTYPFEKQRYSVAPRVQALEVLETTEIEETDEEVTDPADWFAVPVWKQMPPLDLPAAGDHGGPRGPWLLFTSGSGLAETLARRLEERGEAVARVEAGGPHPRPLSRLPPPSPRERGDKHLHPTGIREDETICHPEGEPCEPEGSGRAEPSFLPDPLGRRGSPQDDKGEPLTPNGPGGCLAGLPSPGDRAGGAGRGAGGEGFRRLAPGRYALDPGRPDAYDALLAALAEDGLEPAGILHAWCLGGPAPADSSLSGRLARAEAVAALGFHSLLALAQAWGRRTSAAPLRLTVLSDGLHRIAGETGGAPEKATLLGPVLVTPREIPGAVCRSVDVVLPPAGSAEEDDLADDLLSEIAELAAAEPPVVAWRGGARWTAALAPLRLEAPAEPLARLREGGVYLITGGTGAMGLAFAERFARRARVKLALLSRGGAAGKEERVREIEALGSEVMIVRADVTDPEAMAAAVAAVRERLGPIHGAIHAAGLLGAGLLQRKSRETADAVLAPKVRGALILDHLLRGEPLDFFLLCSSVSAFSGALGQVDYCAANAFLDAFAHWRGRPATAIDWDRWKGEGMAYSAPARAGREVHPLLGVRLEASRERPERTVFAARLGAAGSWVLDEHRLLGRPLLPGTAYLEMARAACEAVSGPGPVEIGDVLFWTPLVVPAGREAEVYTVLDRRGDGGFVVQVLSAEAGRYRRYRRHATGTVRRLDAAAADAARERAGHARERFAALEAAPAEVPGPDSLAAAFGPRWRCLRRYRFAGDEGLADLSLDEAQAGDVATYRLHPALLDAATGFAGSGDGKGDGGAAGFRLPLSYRAVRVLAPLGPSIRSWGKKRASGGETVSADVVVTDPDGEPLVEIEEFTKRRIDPRQGAADLAAVEEGLATGAGQPGARDRSLVDTAEFPEIAAASREDRGLLPAEGADALVRILGRRRLPQVAVTARLLTARPARRSAAVPRREELPARRPEPVQSAVPGDLEETLRRLWGEVLGVADVGLHDNFFALGGDSILGLQVVSRAREAGLELAPGQIFEHQTIAELAAALGNRLGEGPKARASSAQGNALGWEGGPLRGEGPAPGDFPLAGLDEAGLGNLFEQIAAIDEAELAEEER